jgi:TIR domain
VSAFPSEGVFISYRREDAGPYARLLKVKLGQRFPDAEVFMDLDSIEAGLDFAEVIDSALQSCVILIALIGRDWLTITDEDGDRRLDNPDDYVRYEIRTALERCVRVIPVLVDGAKPLRQQQLPDDLGKLARLNALEMSYGRYEYDETRLMAIIQRVLASRTGALEAPPGPASESGSPSLGR